MSAQLIGRSLDIHFPRYHTTKEELKDFKSILSTFQQRLPFEEETDVLLKHWEFCYERSIGCLGNLRLMLIRAVKAAMEADEKTLSMKRLEEHAFSEAEIFEMMREAYEGEKELAPKPEQGIQLRQMLGLLPFTMSKQNASPDLPQEPSNAQNSQNEAKEKTLDEASLDKGSINEAIKSSKKTRARKSQPGRRNPKRDRTGQTMASPDGK